MATSLYFEDHSGRHKIKTSTPASTPTLSQLPKPSAQFPYEFKQIPRYYKSFSKYLEKNINIYKCLQTVEQLLAEKGCTIPDWTVDHWVVTVNPHCPVVMRGISSKYL
jgi:hypothetical protein